MARRTEINPAAAKEIVELVCAEIDWARARGRVTSEASWAALEQFFYEALRDQSSIPTAQMIAWADAGHPAADRAIRRYAAEMLDRGRESELLVQVKAYVVKTLLRPFVPFPRGRHVVQNFMRDLWLADVIQRVAAGTGVPATRAGSTTTPSAAWLVSRGLKRRGFRVSEREANRIHWHRNQLKSAGSVDAADT